jgi:hypothetical protein
MSLHGLWRQPYSQSEGKNANISYKCLESAQIIEAIQFVDYYYILFAAKEGSQEMTRKLIMLPFLTMYYLFQFCS